MSNEAGGSDAISLDVLNLSKATDVSPGFVTDLFGLVAILPFTRPVARRVLSAYVARRVVVVRNTRRPGPPGDVVQGEVVDP